MKTTIKIKLILLIIFSYVQVFAAYSESEELGLSYANQDYNSVLALNGIYKFNYDYNVFPKRYTINGLSEENNSDLVIGVSKNEPVAVRFLNNDEILVTLRLTETEIGKVPEQFVMSAEEFMDLQLNYSSPGNADDLYAKDTGYEEVQLANRSGRVTTKPRTHGFKRDRNGRIMGGNGNCVAVVKRITGFSGKAGNGKGFADALLRTGRWRSIGTKKTKGAVCSWTGGSHGKGHVGWFDGKCFQPVYPKAPCGNPGSRYRLRKCVVPK